MTKTRRRVGAVAVFLGIWLLYYASNPRVPDNYKHHVYVADAWLHGRLDVSGYPAHYHDWITVDGKKYSPFAPAPAMLLVPFVWWRGAAFNMNIFSMAVAGLNAMLCWLVLSRAGVGPRRAALGTLAFAFGTVNWYSAIIGTSWFLAHLCNELFLFLTLFEIFGRRRAVIVGATTGFAVLSRANVVVGLPAILLLLLHRRAVRTGLFRFLDGRAFVGAFLFGIGLHLPTAIELALNYGRFGNPLDTGYSKASEIYPHLLTYGAMYDIRYAPKHLYIAFFKGWEYIEQFPYLKPSPEGLSIVLTSPVLFYALAAPWQDRTVRMLWLVVGCTATAILPYFAQGWVQFGYRHVLDVLPSLIVLVAIGMGTKPGRMVVLLVTFSAVANALGAYWGRALGW